MVTFADARFSLKHVCVFCGAHSSSVWWRRPGPPRDGGHLVDICYDCWRSKAKQAELSKWREAMELREAS